MTHAELDAIEASGDEAGRYVPALVAEVRRLKRKLARVSDGIAAALEEDEPHELTGGVVLDGPRTGVS